MMKTRFGSIFASVVDTVWAGLLWLLCSLPVITLGASTAALYYAIVKCVRHDRDRLTRSFFRAFRDNFRQATLLWLFLLAFVLLGLADVYALESLGLGQSVWLRVAGLALLVPAALLFPWLFAFVSRFQNTLGGTLRYVFYLAVHKLGVTAALLVEMAVFAALGWLLPQLIPLLPGVLCLVMSLSIEPVFRTLTAGQNEGDAWYNE